MASTLARIRRVIAAVPRGKVITYGHAAAAAGFPGAPRLTVRALQNAEGLPWHRVVGAGGRIALPGEDGREQRLRLKMEGVTFRGNRVRMDLHDWVPKARRGTEHPASRPSVRVTRYRDRYGSPTNSLLTDEWVEWHQRYSNDRLLVERLEEVRRQIRKALDGSPPGSIRAISMCSGDGRDLLGVLADHRRANDVSARFVDLSPELVAAGREQIRRLRLPRAEFVLGDAGTTTAYAGAVPANLVLACGVFGNIRDEDIRRTIDTLPELCARDATVVWTRGTFEPDLTPAIRDWFRDAGFTEISFRRIPGTTASVGTHRLTKRARRFRSGVRLFTFLPRNERPSSRAARARTESSSIGPRRQIPP